MLNYNNFDQMLLAKTKFWVFESVRHDFEMGLAVRGKTKCCQRQFIENFIQLTDGDEHPRLFGFGVPVAFVDLASYFHQVLLK